METKKITVVIEKNLDINSLEYLRTVDGNVEIEFLPKTNVYDEREYISIVGQILKNLGNHNRAYKVMLHVDNRELLMRSGILELNNFVFSIFCDFNYYSKEEFLAEDVLLNEFVTNIISSDLSPFEKYLAVFYKVASYKWYFKERKGDHKGKELRWVLDKNNKSYVCVGFAKLLKALLDKIGISCYLWYVQMDNTRTEGYDEETMNEFEGHVRNIVKLDDDKYDIHGIFIADAVVDNNKSVPHYNMAAITFDRLKEFIELEGLSNEDLLLDFHDMSDFSEKINYLLKKEINKKKRRNNDKVTGSDIIDAYLNVITEILNLLLCLDYEKYKYFNELFNNKIKPAHFNYMCGICSFKQVEDLCIEFFTIYAQTIIKMTNKPIADDIMEKALVGVLKAVGFFETDEDAKDCASDVINIKKRLDREKFPYKFDTKNAGNSYENGGRPNYLEVSGIIRRK